jgi:hypothetical protein
MTVAMRPASRRRSLSPPAPRRNTNAMFARCPQSLPDRCERDTPAQVPPSKTSAVAGSPAKTDRRRLPPRRSPAVRHP